MDMTASHKSLIKIVKSKVKYLLFACPVLIASSCFANDIQVQVVSHQKQPLKGIVVYLEAIGRHIALESKASAINIGQKNKGFAPYVSVVQSGTSVTFSNQDDITHHIYSVTGNKKFTYTIRSGEASSPLEIDQKGIIAMGCNIHDWMSGYILVLDTPYYTKTDANGVATVYGLEHGKYRIVAWHPQLQERLVKETFLPSASPIVLQLQKKMAKIPSQKGVDDFDFLDGY